MRAIALVLTLSLAGWAQAARAFDDTGISLSIRAGYGLPLGDAGKDFKMSDLVSGQVPLEADLTFRFTRQLGLGAYVGYGFAFASDKICQQVGPLPTGVSCKASNASTLRYGLMLSYRFHPSDDMTPWFGLGAGFEQAQVDVKASGLGQTATETLKASGWEYGNLTIGVDWEVATKLKVGPFIRGSLVKFDTSKTSTGGKESIPSSDQTFHEWITLGLKGTFDL
jgi:opacity protein-like surface antigen